MSSVPPQKVLVSACLLGQVSLRYDGLAQGHLISLSGTKP